MKYYVAIINDPTSPENGKKLANTKMPYNKYQGMTKEQFTEATKYICIYRIKIVGID
jgi:uncharacterized protein (DUF3820 family)